MPGRSACAAIVALGVLPVLLAGCGGGPNELTVMVSNPDHVGGHAAVEAWLRIESVRGDVKHNGPLTVRAGEVEEFSMGDLQGMLRFTAIVLGHTHSEVEQMEPDEDWTVDIRADGSTCFRFGIDNTGELRCG